MASGNPGDGKGDGRSQRPPKDVKDLLRICAEVTDPENPNQNVSFQAMSQERREFLESALDQMTVNPVGEVQKCVKCILDPETDIDDKLEALDSAKEWCEQMDIAIDFHKIGGFEIFSKCFESSEAELRWGSLELIGNLVQNNPYCQKAVIENDLLPKLLQILDNDENATVKTKALYALSCLVREYPEALDLFVQNDGFSSVMRAMQTDVEKLKIKSAFMLSAVCVDNNKCKDILCDMGMIEQLLGLLGEEHSLFHEHLMSALLTIIRGHPRSLQECLRPELNMLPLLKQKEQDLKGKDEFKEEHSYTVEMIELLTENGDTDQDLER